MSSIKKESLTNFVKMLADVSKEERDKVLEALLHLNYKERQDFSLLIIKERFFYIIILDIYFWRD